MKNTKDLIEGLILIAIGIYNILYYTDYLPLSAEKDKIRQERIKKHGPIAIFLCVLVILIGIIFLTLGII